MKSYAVLALATAVAADYGHAAYTTVYPGHGKGPVTVTAQYQPVPTYVHGKWSQYNAVSTVITDAYGKKITVTATDQCVTVYQSKKTVTHTRPAKPTGYGAQSPKTWNELYQEIHEVSYDHLGPHGIPGYSGNPMCRDNEEQQKVTIKRYNGGKWSTYAHTYNYYAPKPSVTTYANPGTYTVPARDITVSQCTTVAVEQTYSAMANKPFTCGGQTTDVTKPTTITASYAAYETQGSVTKTVIRSKTITCPHAGKYTVAEPTVTVYPHDTTVAYPTITDYPAGVYHHPAQTVTITKSNEPYTCSYEQTSAYPTATAYGTPTQPYGPDPSSDYDEPTENYGHTSPGYVKRGGVLQRRNAESGPAKAGAKAHILV